MNLLNKFFFSKLYFSFGKSEQKYSQDHLFTSVKKQKSFLKELKFFQLFHN